MLTREEARTIAVANLPEAPAEITLVIMDDLTIAKPYGWVFFFNSKQYLETNSILHAIGGNGPMIVTHGGRCIRLGSGGGDGEQIVASYEKEHWLSLKMPF